MIPSEVTPRELPSRSNSLMRGGLGRISASFKKFGDALGPENHGESPYGHDFYTGRRESLASTNALIDANVAEDLLPHTIATFVQDEPMKKLTSAQATKLRRSKSIVRQLSKKAFIKELVKSESVGTLTSIATTVAERAVQYRALSKRHPSAASLKVLDGIKRTRRLRLATKARKLSEAHDDLFVAINKGLAELHIDI